MILCIFTFVSYKNIVRDRALFITVFEEANSVLDISAQVHHRKTGKPVIFSIGSDDPYDYCVVTVYQVLVTQPYKGMTGIVETVVSNIGNWYEMGPARKKELERVGIEPQKLLVDYGSSVGLEKGSSYLFCVSESENGYMTPLDYKIGWDTDWEAATKIKEQLSPMMPPLLTLGIIVVVLAAATVATVLLIRKKKKKTETTEEVIPENE